MRNRLDYTEQPTVRSANMLTLIEKHDSLSTSLLFQSIPVRNRAGKRSTIGSSRDSSAMLFKNTKQRLYFLLVAVLPIDNYPCYMLAFKIVAMESYTNILPPQMSLKHHAPILSSILQAFFLCLLTQYSTTEEWIWVC